MMNTKLELLVFTMLAFLGVGGVSFGQSCQEQWVDGATLPGTNGVTSCGVLWDPDGEGPQPKLYVLGGQFSVAGKVFAKNIAAWNTETGEWSAFGAGVTSNLVGTVNAAVVMPDNSLVVGGSFTSAGGHPVSNLARWDGVAWSPVGGGTDGVVRALLVLPNGDLAVAGSFPHAGGTTVNGIGIWNGVSWASLGSGVLGTSEGVYSICLLPNGELAAGGNFTAIGGVYCFGFSIWNGSNWGAHGVISPTNYGDPRTLGVDPAGNLYLCSSIYGVYRLVGTTWVQASVRAKAHAIPLASGRLIIAFDASQVNGVPVLAQLAEATSGELVPFGGLLAHAPATIVETPSGDLLASDIGGVARLRGSSTDLVLPTPTIARYSAGAWQRTQRGFDGEIRAMALASGGNLYVGGSFRFADDVESRHIAMWDGSAWRAMNRANAPAGSTGLDATITSIKVLRDGRVAATGYGDAGLLTQNTLALWDGADWHSLMSAPANSSLVSDIAETLTGEIVAAGRFSSIGGVAAANVARYNGTAWEPMGAAFTPGGEAKVVVVGPDGGIYVAGSISTQSAIRYYVARWDGADWAYVGGPQAWFNGEIKAMTFDARGRLIIAGRFLGGNTILFAPGAAIWNGEYWQSAAAESGNNSGRGAKAVVVLPSGEWLAGCHQESDDTYGAGYYARKTRFYWGVAQYSLVGSADYVGGSNYSSIDAMCVTPEGDVWVAGDFSAIAGVPANRLVRNIYRGTPILWNTSLVGSVCPGSDVSLNVTLLGSEPVTYQWYRDGRQIAANENPSAITPTLSLRVNDASDAGSYYCLVSNECHSINIQNSVSVYPAWRRECGGVGCDADVNHDDVVDQGDIDAVIEIIGGGENPWNVWPDFNLDGVLDQSDVDVIINAVAGGDCS